MRLRIPLLLGLAVVTTAIGARAQQPDANQGEKLFLEARALIRAGNYAAACPKLDVSQQLDPAPGTLMNLADCEEHVGKLLYARRLWRDLLQTLPEAGDERRTHAEQRLAALEKRIPIVVVKIAPSAPPTTIVLRDSVELPAGAIGNRLPVDPGEQRFTARAPGRKGLIYRFPIAEGQTYDLTVAPGKVDPDGTPAVEAGPLPVAQPAPQEARRTEVTHSPPKAQKNVGYVFMGAGAVALTLGGVGLVANWYANNNRFDERPGFGALQAALLSGGPLTLIGVILVATAPESSKGAVTKPAQTSTRITVHPVGTLGLGLTGTF